MENAKSRSLLAIINAALTEDGTLPQDFSLPDEENSSGLRFADGASDGIGIYHIGAPQITNEIRESIKSAVDAASHRDTERAEELFRALSEKISAIRAIDELQSYIIENKDSLSAPDLYDCAAKLMVNSSNRECVKFGMSILELFNIEDNKPLANAVETLGQSDEFTIFSLFIMSRWKNANEHIFALAKRVHGWGRIHAVERLEPETDEIKSWLLREGVNNDVLPPYSALPCWKKSGAEEILQNPDLSDEDFMAIARIIDALLDEGPCAGISAIENHEQILAEFLNIAKTRTLTINEYVIIRNIRITFEDNPEITDLCQSILNTDNCRESLKSNITAVGAVALAKDLGIDFKDDIVSFLETDFGKGCYLCGELMDDSHRARTIDIFREKLPFDKLLATPSGIQPLGEDFQIHNQLNTIVQELRNYPLEGTDLIEFSLKCGPVRDRILALNALQSWVNIRKTPLETLLPEIFHIIQRSIRIEPDNNVRDKMEKLLNGEFDND